MIALINDMLEYGITLGVKAIRSEKETVLRGKKKKAKKTVN